MGKIKKYWLPVATFIAGYVVCMILGAGNASAANESYVEGGVQLPATAIDNIQTESAKLYITGYKNVNRYVDVEINLDTTLDDSKFSERVDGSVTGWVTPVKSEKGRVRCGLTVFGGYAEKELSVAKEGVVDCNGRLYF